MHHLFLPTQLAEVGICVLMFFKVKTETMTPLCHHLKGSCLFQCLSDCASCFAEIDAAQQPQAFPFKSKYSLDLILE